MTLLVPPGIGADSRLPRVCYASDDSTQSVAKPCDPRSSVGGEPNLGARHSGPATHEEGVTAPPPVSAEDAAPVDRADSAAASSPVLDEADATPHPQPALGGDGEATVISKLPPQGSAGGSGHEAADAERPSTTVADVGRALVGRRLGVYELEEFVGGGGMGAVFRGRDTTLDRTVAVKVLFQHRTNDAELLRRFKNEAQSAARLDHENIGRVYAVGSEEGWHYIVFEFIEGVNLRDLVHEQGPYEIARTITITSQLADALAHAETRNVVHRDIKPSNVIITPAGKARLVDMGLARLHQMTGDRDLTVSGMTLGTFDYISPEQARDPRLADVRSDLYSLGCTAYFMLVGRPPFAEGTMVQKLLQHQQQQAVAVDRIRPDVPRELAEVIERLMEKDPADRYQHPAELVEALSAVAAVRGIKLPNARAGVVPHEKPRTLKLADHVPWLVPIVGFMAIVAALWFSSRQERAEGVAVDPATAPPRDAAAAADSEMLGVRHRVVDAPDQQAQGWVEHVSLADAVAAAADGDWIELAFSDVRDEPPIAITGKQLTIRAAEGMRPEVRFSGFATESLARERAGFLLDTASLTLENVAVTLAVSSDTVDPAARLFLLRGGSQLRVQGCGVRLEGLAVPLVESRRPRCIEVLAGQAAGDEETAATPPPSVASSAEEAAVVMSRVEFSETTVRGDMTFLEVAGEGQVDLIWSGGSLATDGRCLVVEGASRDVEQGTLLHVSLQRALFACREGFACLLDSPARPTEPRLDVTATGCRFLTPEGVPLIEQSGIEDPEVYRGRVRWADAGSRYEGTAIFRRIDGAAESVEIDFPSLAQPMQFLPQIEAWPSDSLFDEVTPQAERPGRAIPSPGNGSAATQAVLGPERPHVS